MRPPYRRGGCFSTCALALPVQVGLAGRYFVVNPPGGISYVLSTNDNGRSPAGRRVLWTGYRPPKGGYQMAGSPYELDGYPSGGVSYAATTARLFEDTSRVAYPANGYPPMGRFPASWEALQYCIAYDFHEAVSKGPRSGAMGHLLVTHMRCACAKFQVGFLRTPGRDFRSELGIREIPR